MLSIRRIAACIPVLLGVMAFTPHYAEAQTSYALICRGGPGLRLAPETGASGASVVRLRFTRGTRAAATGVEPGTCAWQDRGVRSNEPAALCFAPVQHLSFETAGGREIAWLRIQASGGDAPVIFWEGGERPDGIAYQPSNPGELEYYRAFHDSSRACLAVTHVGP